MDGLGRGGGPLIPCWSRGFPIKIPPILVKTKGVNDFHGYKPIRKGSLAGTDYSVEEHITTMAKGPNVVANHKQFKSREINFERYKPRRSGNTPRSGSSQEAPQQKNPPVLSCTNIVGILKQIMKGEKAPYAMDPKEVSSQARNGSSKEEGMHEEGNLFKGVENQQEITPIQAYAMELNDLNEEITEAIEDIERRQREREALDCVAIRRSSKVQMNTNVPAFISNGDIESISWNSSKVEDEDKSEEMEQRQKSQKSIFRQREESKSMFGLITGKMQSTSTTLLKSIIGPVEDGAVRNAGFVTFSTLLAKHQCQQTIHHSIPFTFSAMAAPRPEDILWGNVGVPHKEQQISNLLAQVATVATCLFWTIPVSLSSSLSEVDGLKKLIPGFEKILVKNAWLELFLANVCPLVLVMLTAPFPGILTMYCKREGHVGLAELNASLLTKLSSFMIIQIFFIQTLSGSITAALQEIMEDWMSIVDLMATTIPLQVKSFIQFVIVKNSLGCSIELLQVARVKKEFNEEHQIGSNLVKRESGTQYVAIIPMAEPDRLEYPMLFAEMILFFMINLVYSCIAPVMSYIMLICFGILSLTFRHQLIYTYSKDNDDGGKLWSSAIMMILTCMIVSEITMIGMIFLKKAFVAGVTLLPLVVCSFFFVSYVKQQHFRVTEYVPSILCATTDKANDGKLDLSFLKDQYLQDALKDKVKFPRNMRRGDVEGYGSNSGNNAKNEV